MSENENRGNPSTAAPGDTKLDRRRFVRGAAVSALAGTATACSGGEAGGPAVQATPRVRWRLASSYPRGLDTLYGVNEYLAERVETLSEGRFSIRPYAAGEIVPGLEVMDAAQQGTVQVGHTASYYYIGKNPALAFDTGVPFGMTTRQKFAWLYEAGGGELVNQLYADFNILSFSGGSTGTQMGGWFRNQLHSLDDLNGLRMRIPGLGGEVMRRLGVTVQVLAGGDIYASLERGAIDATEWVGPYDDEKLGFQRVASNYYYPGWWEPGPTLAFMVNRDAWDALPSTFQEIFRSVSIESAMIMTARYDALNPPAMQRLLAAGVQMRPFPNDIMVAAHRISFELYEEQAAADPAYRRIYEQWKAARASFYGWFDTAEQAYAKFAFPRTGEV